MITAKNSVAINNSGHQVSSYNLVMTPEVFKVFYSSLYENKEMAVIRELVANGDDSHKVAGLKDVPVVINLPTELVPELSIVDQGVGMSLEDINTVFTCYGKSTKGASNDEIGGFGYGAKCPFSISPSFTVETTKNGITTVFVNFIDKSGPDYVVTSSEYTGKPSGTTVRVPVADKVIRDTLEEVATGPLFALWEVPPVINNSLRVNQTLPISKLDEDLYYLLTYSIAQRHLNNTVSCGPFAYKIPQNLQNRLNERADYAFLQKVVHKVLTLSKYKEYSHIIPKFGVGELELSPSRERIEDTKENEEKIVKRIEEIYQSLVIPETTAEAAYTHCYNVYKKYGVRYSEIIDKTDNDLVLSFSDAESALEMLLPDNWKRNNFVIAAYVYQMDKIQDSVNVHSSIETVPEWLIPLLLSNYQRYASRKVRGTTAGSVIGAGDLYSMIRDTTEDSATSELTKAVITNLDMKVRHSTRYYRASTLYDGMPIFIVPAKNQPLVSRCILHLKDYADAAVVFTDDKEKQEKALRNLAKHFKWNFKIVDEATLKELVKTVPKKTRTTSTVTGTSRATVDRRAGRVFSHNDGSFVPVTASGVTSLLTEQNTGFLIVVDNIPRGRNGLYSFTCQLLKMTNNSVFVVSESDYSKPKIAKVYAPYLASKQLTELKISFSVVNKVISAALCKTPKVFSCLVRSTEKVLLDEASFKERNKQNLETIYVSRPYNFAGWLKQAGETDIVRVKWAGASTDPTIRMDKVMSSVEFNRLIKAIEKYVKQTYTPDKE